MGSAQRRARATAKTRRQILDAARDLFVTEGYEATSMRAIAERIEYTPTAIYHHFESKQALLDELCAQDFRVLSMAFERAGDVSDPIERIARIGGAYVEFALEHPMHYQFMFMTVRPGTLDAQAARSTDPTAHVYAVLRDSVAGAIDAGRLLPEYADVDQVAQILWGVLHGLLALRITGGARPWVDFTDIRQTAGTAQQTVLRGLLRA